jgi:hypothetical protein
MGRVNAIFVNLGATNGFTRPEREHGISSSFLRNMNMMHPEILNGFTHDFG